MKERPALGLRSMMSKASVLLSRRFLFRASIRIRGGWSKMRRRFGAHSWTPHGAAWELRMSALTLLWLSASRINARPPLSGIARLDNLPHPPSFGNAAVRANIALS